MEKNIPEGFSTEFLDSDEGKELYSQIQSSMTDYHFVTSRSLKRSYLIIQGIFPFFVIVIDLGFAIHSSNPFTTTLQVVISENCDVWNKHATP